MELYGKCQQDEFVFAYDPFKQPIDNVLATTVVDENAALEKYGLTEGCFKFIANEFTGRFEIEALANGEWIPFEGHFVDGRSTDFYNWEVPEELAKRNNSKQTYSEITKMDTMEMITKAPEKALEQKVAEKAAVMTTESVIEWLEGLRKKARDSTDLKDGIDFGYASDRIAKYLLTQTWQCDIMIAEYLKLRDNQYLDTDNDYKVAEFFNEHAEDYGYIQRDEIDVSIVDECGLLEDCFNEYVENNSLKEIVKDLMDRL